MIEQSLKDILQDSFDIYFLEIDNQSQLHAGHASSPNSGESHFEVFLVSDDFEGLNRVKRHQAVNNVVKPLFNKGLHALSLRLLSVSEYNDNL